MGDESSLSFKFKLDARSSRTLSSSILGESSFKLDSTRLVYTPTSGV